MEGYDIFNVPIFYIECRKNAPKLTEGHEQDYKRRPEKEAPT
jgi:hypothetical protein